MRWTVLGRAALGGVVLAAAPLLSGGQGAAPAPALKVGRAAAPPAVEAIQDPATGYGWELVRGPDGGPGRWIRSAAPPSFNRGAGEAKRRCEASPVIRAGERLLVAEDTPRARVRMVVVALEPACLGRTLRVRAAIGGRVLRAVALGAGRARLSAGRWGRP